VEFAASCPVCVHAVCVCVYVYVNQVKDGSLVNDMSSSVTGLASRVSLIFLSVSFACIRNLNLESFLCVPLTLLMAVRTVSRDATYLCKL